MLDRLGDCEVVLGDVDGIVIESALEDCGVFLRDVSDLVLFR